MTFLSPLLFAAIAVVVGYLSSMKADVKKIAVHDESGLFTNTFNSTDEYKYLMLSDVEVPVLLDSISKERYEGVLFIPDLSDTKQLASKIKYISNDSPGIDFIHSLETIIAHELTKANFVQNKLDTVAIANSQAEVSIKLAKASGEESVRGLNEIKIGIGGLFGYLLMMFIIIYGNMVMRSVIEEKTNRIVEIIISSVKPFQLMMGKIIGTSLAGILQFLIWSVIGVGLLFAASLFFDVQMGPAATASAQMMEAAQQQSDSTVQLYIKELWELPIATIIISFIIYFIGGYFLYSSFYAAIGAAVDSETDSQQFLLPIMLPLILGVYIGIFTVINDPHGTVATVFSMIPLTSPIVMLMRIPFGVPIWQLVLSVVILFATFLLVVWFAAKIYRVGILMYGKKPTWREMIRWVRY
jgi:ABC-2 type transport system permease protein